MPTFRTGTVTSVLSERPGLQRLEVALAGERAHAYCLTALSGSCEVGDRVVLNTTAVDLGLGSGGWHVVHWNLAREELHLPGAGHVLKLRYTSLQADTGTAEERPGYAPPDDLGGRPVVACFLHSQVAMVAAAAAATAPGIRAAYVMTDGAALPLALSDVVHALRERGLLAATVTAGNAFGGDHEAVNLPSALDVAFGPAAADLVVVGPGPGVVGTDTPRGFSGMEVATVVDAAAARGALPVVAVRWSDADPRPRHRGVSHHVRTALEHARCRATLAVPAGEALPGTAHAEVEVEVPDPAALLRRTGLDLSTMGRGVGDDPGFFRWAAAAGVLAASLVRS